MITACGDALLTAEDVAQLLAVETQTLAVWRAENRYLPFVRLGGKRAIRYRLADVREFIRQGIVVPAPSSSTEAAP